MGNTHSSAIKSPLECVNSVQVKREDEHTAEDIVGSNNRHDGGGIEIKNKNDDDDDDDDAASVHEDQEEKILPMPADDCCAGSKSDVQQHPPPQPVKTPPTSGERRKPGNQDAASAPQKRKKTRREINADRFDDWCKQLLQFKEEFGHCNATRSNSKNPSLANWCNNIRSAYKKIQEGGNPICSLSPDIIERLDKMGFQWKIVDHKEAFEKHCFELEAFKEEFGHCIVPLKYPKNNSLANWCHSMRYSYSQIQKGMKPRCSLSQDKIDQLEKIGFQWQVVCEGTFEKRCFELEAFKEEFGHCNVPVKYPKNQSFGHWFHRMRYSYRQIQKGIKPRFYLSQDMIEQLETIGLV